MMVIIYKVVNKVKFRKKSAYQAFLVTSLIDTQLIRK